MPAKMKRFFDLTFRWFFIITGIGTASATLYAFWPRRAAETVGKIPFVPDYTIITQHWGTMVGLKNKISMLLMEAGVSYNKQRLHKAGYFRELLATNPDIQDGLGSLLRLCRETVVRLGKTESALVRSLEHDSLLVERIERLMTIPAVGPNHGHLKQLEMQP